MKSVTILILILAAMQTNPKFDSEIAPFLRAKLEDEIRLYNLDPNALKRANPLIERWGREDHNSEQHRYDLLKQILKERFYSVHIMDLAAGCGNFVFQGQMQNLNVEGIEPEEWKNELWKKKIDAFHLNPEWIKKFHNGIGEKLPFAKNSFDVVDSWQTFEHVQSVKDCMSEMFRVLTHDGIAVIRMPSYASFYEGHYMMPWFPYLHGNLAKLWLRVAGRPTAGLKTFYIRTQCSMKREARKAGFLPLDLKKILYQKHLASKRGITNKMLSGIIYHLRMLVTNFKNIFRQERYVHLLLVKEAEHSLAKDFLNK